MEMFCLNIQEHELRLVDALCPPYRGVKTIPTPMLFELSCDTCSLGLARRLTLTDGEWLAMLKRLHVESAAIGPNHDVVTIRIGGGRAPLCCVVGICAQHAEPRIVAAIAAERGVVRQERLYSNKGT